MELPMDQAGQTAYLRICKVLKIFLEDPTFFPRQQDFEELNPTRDKIKIRIHKIEACWDWRDRVLKSMRIQKELYQWEWRFRRSYMTQGEREAFHRLYDRSEENFLAERAAKKVERNMSRLGVFWE